MSMCRVPFSGLERITFSCTRTTLLIKRAQAGTIVKASFSHMFRKIHNHPAVLELLASGEFLM